MLVAGLGMETVDVLGDDAADAPQLLESCQSDVSGVGLHVGTHERSPLDGHAPALPAVLGIAYVVLDRELRLVVALPEAVGPPEVRDPRLGRDPGAGEGHAVAGALQPVGYLIERV